MRMAARMPSNKASFSKGFSISTAPAAAAWLRTAALGCVVIRIAGSGMFRRRNSDRRSRPFMPGSR